MPPKLKREAKALKEIIQVGWGRGDTEAFHRIFIDLFVPGGSEKEYRYLAELQRKTTTPKWLPDFGWLIIEL